MLQSLIKAESSRTTQHLVSKPGTLRASQVKNEKEHLQMKDLCSLSPASTGLIVGLTVSGVLVCGLIVILAVPATRRTVQRWIRVPTNNNQGSY